MINLRPYQKEAVDVVKRTFKSQKRQYIEMPTGSGKTITFLTYAFQNHNSVLIIVPSKELLKQIYESCLIFYKAHEISRKGDQYNEKIAKIHICIINSVRGKYLEYLCNHAFDLVIIDECHHAQSESYRRLINLYSKRFNETKFLGVTATPNRMDGLLLKEILHQNSFRIDIETLIQNSYLSDIEGFSVKTKIDLSDIDSHNGDFNLRQLYNKLCTQDRNEMIVNICKKEMKDRKVIIFCINIEHSKQINKMLNEANISSMHIDGRMNIVERNAVLSAFRNGEISFICNCQLLSEGFDEPSIDGIILARPTMSKALFTQMIGRGLRIYPGKRNCKIIDIVDNHKSLIGFNELLEDQKIPEIHSFKSIKDIRAHIGKEMLKITEFTIERINLLDKKISYTEFEATDAMIKYLENNEIKFFQPISFDEASFLMWFNELKKEYANGIN